MSNEYFQKENVFGKNIHFPIAVFKNHPNLHRFIKSQLDPLFDKLEMNSDKAFNTIVDTCSKYLEQYNINKTPNNGRLVYLTEETEKELHRTFGFFDDHHQKNKCETQRISQLKDRAEKIYMQIRVPLLKYLEGKEVYLLDMGCGDGLITWTLKENEKDLNFKLKRTYLADVNEGDNQEYRVPEVKRNEKDFPFIPLSPMFTDLNIPNGKGPVRFDCILLLTVLHHSIEPRDVFLACQQLLKEDGIIIAIESCVGITDKFINNNYSTKGKNILSQKDQQKALEKFLNLTDQEEIMYATFIDWFYNRVLHRDVIVTYNFNSPSSWNNLFEGYRDMYCKETYCEGFDQLTVPEFHTIHVIKKSNGR